MKTYTEEEVVEIIKIAFRKGEFWGATYQGWFTPTEEDTEKHFEATKEYIFDGNSIIEKATMLDWMIMKNQQ